MQNGRVLDFSKKQDLSHLNKLSEASDWEAKKASFGARALAVSIDGIIQQVILITAVAIMGGILQKKPGPGQMVFQFAIAFILYIVPIYLWGQTAGKKIMKIKVIPANPKIKNLGFWQVLGRETIGKIASAIFLGYGFLCVLWDKNKQGTHDKFSKTYVVSVSDTSANV